MHTHVRRWGNSPSVRIPRSLMVAAGLEMDEPISITEEGGAIVIRPLERPFDLRAAVDSITAENIPDPEDVDFGPPVGREVW